MSRWLRERPRLAAAQLALAAAAMGVAVLVGSALAGDGADREASLEQRPPQASERQGHQNSRLIQAKAELERLRGELATTERAARSRSRASRRLRRNLATTRRALRRARAP